MSEVGSPVPARRSTQARQDPINATPYATSAKLPIVSLLQAKTEVKKEAAAFNGCQMTACWMLSALGPDNCQEDNVDWCCQLYRRSQNFTKLPGTNSALGNDRPQRHN